MRQILAAVVLWLLIGSTALWAAPLSGGGDHWATDALRTLQARGLLEGYPDGTFKGDRAMSRYEVAALIARALAQLEQGHAQFASKTEVQELLALVRAYQAELTDFGVRIGNLEEQTLQLDKRVDELARIRFYGRLQTVVVSNSLAGSADRGTLANPGIDWSSGRLLVAGQGLTASGTLGFNARIDDALKTGGEFVAFTSQGNLGVDSYWGVSSPYLTNPWTIRGGGDPNAQPQSNLPFTRMVLDNFWVHHEPSGTRLTLGSFHPEHMPGYVLRGPRNPNVHLPNWLSFYGADVRGRLGGPDSGLSYELLFTLLPTAVAYPSRSLGATLRYQFRRGEVRVAAANSFDQNHDDGTLLGAGLTALPAVPFTGPGLPSVPTNTWLDQRTGTARSMVGPQGQTSLGLNARYRLVEDCKLDLFTEFSTTDYNPDRSHRFFDTTVGGSLLRVGVRTEPTAGLSLSLDYQRVDPTYDPMILAYPLPPNVPVFLPYGAYYSNYYQLHDYLNYPNNRQGFHVRGDYRFNDGDTRVWADLGGWSQVRPTTPAQVQTPGNIEPLFGMLQAGGNQKGQVSSLGLGLDHTFENRLLLQADYYRYSLNRDAPAIDDVDLLQDVARLQLSYPLADDFRMRASYYLLEYRGHTGLLNTNFQQQVPGIGLDFAAGRSTSLSLDYRYFNLRDRNLPLASYDGNQLMMEMKVDF